MPAAPLVIPRSVPGFGYGPPPDDPRAGELTVWGLLVACLIAVGLPTLGFVVIRVLSIPAIGGTNWGLVLGLAAMSLTSAVVIGHLSSERRRRAGPLRAAAAAGLALASNAMLLQLVSTHPVKFGFDLSVLGLIPALLPIALAGWLAFTPPEDDR